MGGDLLEADVRSCVSLPSAPSISLSEFDWYKAKRCSIGTRTFFGFLIRQFVSGGKLHLSILEIVVVRATTMLQHMGKELDEVYLIALGLTTPFLIGVEGFFVDGGGESGNFLADVGETVRWA